MADSSVAVESSSESTEATAAHVDTLRGSIEISLDLLDTITAEFKEDDSRDADEWRKRIAEVRATINYPEAVIGVVGSTGVGKSKCINALLGQDLLPTSDSQACTAAPVEILYNDDAEGALFKAIIEFIAEDDWTKEMHLLISEMSKDEDSIDWDSIQSGADDDPAKCALDKFEAVYPAIVQQRPEQLDLSQLITGEIQEYLGSSMSIETDNLDDFSDQLRPYIGCQFEDDEAGETRPFEFWPLISKIRIWDKADILETGVRLVDLPGLHDNNAARATIAGNYLSQCSSVLVMTPIVRAKNDKWAIEFLGSRIARELRLNGSLHHIAFVCTKIDQDLDTNPSRVPGLRDEIKPLQEDVSQLKKSKDQLNKSLRALEKEVESLGRQTKRTSIVHKRPGNSQSPPSVKKWRNNASQAIQIVLQSEHGSDAPIAKPSNAVLSETNSKVSSGNETSDAGQADLGNELTRLFKEKDRINKEREAADRKITQTLSAIKNLQIKHRNNESRKSIQKYFAGVLKREVRSSKQDDYTLMIQPPQVLCVCSQMFLKMRAEEELADAARNGFLDTDETGIPALRRHCESFAIDLRMKSLERFYNAMFKLINSLNLWANDGIGAGDLSEEEFSMKEKHLRLCLKIFRTKLAFLVQKSTDKIAKALDQQICSVILNAEAQAVNGSREVSDKWSRILGVTYRAIVRRNGAYTNRKGMSFEFNDDLGRSFNDAIMDGWTHFFNRRVPRIFDKFAQKCVLYVDDFDLDSCEQLRLMGAYHDALLTLEEQTATTAKMVSNHFEDAKQTIMQQRSARKLIFERIIDHMQPGYEQVKDDSGPGMGLRIKGGIAQHVEQVKAAMYHEATNIIQEKLEATVKEAHEKLLNNMISLAEHHTKDYQSFLTEESKEIRERQIKHSKVISPLLSRHRSESLDDTLKLLESLGYGKHNLAAHITDDAPRSRRSYQAFLESDEGDSGNETAQIESYVGKPYENKTPGEIHSETAIRIKHEDQE